MPITVPQASDNLNTPLSILNYSWRTINLVLWESAVLVLWLDLSDVNKNCFFLGTRNEIFKFFLDTLMIVKEKLTTMVCKNIRYSYFFYVKKSNDIFIDQTIKPGKTQNLIHAFSIGCFKSRNFLQLQKQHKCKSIFESQKINRQ